MRALALALGLALTAAVTGGATKDATAQYAAVQSRLAAGWNTWNTQSVLSHVLLPEGLSVTVGLHAGTLYSARYLDQAQPGGREPAGPQIAMGPHALNGAYSELTVSWNGLRARIESATEGGDLLVLVTPLKTPDTTALLDVEVGLLWNRAGHLERNGDAIDARLPSREIRVFGAGQAANDLDVPVATPYLTLALSGPAGIVTGHRRTLGQITEAIGRARRELTERWRGFGVDPETVGAVQSALGWNTIFDPAHGRVITPVSRAWNPGWGGYVLFDWDTFFAGLMASRFDRDLAYANIIEMLNETTPDGFVPNYAAGSVRSLDRSEPPVGALVVHEVYRRWHDRWLLEACFDRLLRWNRWWHEHREVDGWLVWGTDPTHTEFDRQDSAVNTLQGAKYESGLDNSPLYDGATFDPTSHLMKQADVGLMGLYAADCRALAAIADELGRPAEAAELRARRDAVAAKLAELWDEGQAMYFNRDLTTGKPVVRMAPTNFYPLLAGIPTPAQAQAMVNRHLLNPSEMGGTWMVPSIARNDPAFRDQDYWRGRIWGPMNLLIYLGLREYPLPEARRELAAKSEALLLREWKDKGHIHENTNAITGDGDDVSSSDQFYHWGALLGYIAILEAESATGAH
ncbi:MAG TPA: trehalase family glycosidase [Candidatus Didemnitutus sp.]|nr:trehalase family glycosidase [Candidatus Didemnitutus sp.]